MRTMIITLLYIVSVILNTGCSDSNCNGPAIGSPYGSIPFGEKVCSPDNKMYAREVEPSNQGNIGIYDVSTEENIKIMDVRQHPEDRSNELKGLAWSPDSKWLAVMYHYNGGGHISIMNVETGEEVKQLPIKRHYHEMRFSSDGARIEAGGEDLIIG